MDQEREKRYFATLGLERKNEAKSPVSSQRQEEVGVDKVVNFSLQAPNSLNGPCSCHSEEGKGQDAFSINTCNMHSGSHERGNDARENDISYIDADDDQGAVFPNKNQNVSPEDVPGKAALFGLENGAGKQNSKSSPNFENFVMRYQGSGMSADIDDAKPTRTDAEKLEFAETHLQQQRAPPPILYGHPPMNFIAEANGQGEHGHRERSRSQHGRRRDYGTPNQEMVDDAKNEGEKRYSSEVYSTRTGKVMRRKQREDKSVKRSEEIEGYRGYEEVDNVLAYIEGIDLAKKHREEQGKRTKKKSGGSADHGNVTQKKEKAWSPTNVDAETPAAEPKPADALDSVATNCDDVVLDRDIKNVETEKQPETCIVTKASSDSALAELLQVEDLALQSVDLPSSMQSATVEDKSKFVTVSNRKQKQMRSYDRIFRASKYKRATTPPPSAAPKASAAISSQIARQRRNSYDYSFGAFSSTVAAMTSVKDASIISPASSCSFRAKTGVGAISEVTTVVSHTVLDNADSDFNNASFSSVDGEMVAAAVKMSYANVAAAVAAPRANQECGKGGLKTTDQDKALRKEPTSNSDLLGSVPSKTIPTSPRVKDRAFESAVDVEFPSLSSVANVESVYGGTAGDGEKRSGKVPEAVSLPPSKLDMRKGFDGMEFVYVSAPNAENADKNGERFSDSGPIRDPSSNAVSGSGQEVLKMLFDSCKSCDASGGVNQRANISSSCLSIKSDNGNYGPAVQFMGMAAPSSDSAFNFSFIFGETEDDNVIKEVMTRSISVTAPSTKGDALNASALSLDMDYEEKKRENGNRGLGTYPLMGMPLERRPGNNKAFEEMAAFMQASWSKFVRDGNYVVYKPEKN